MRRVHDASLVRWVSTFMNLVKIDRKLLPSCSLPGIADGGETQKRVSIWLLSGSIRQSYRVLSQRPRKNSPARSDCKVSRATPSAGAVTLSRNDLLSKTVTAEENPARPAPFSRRTSTVRLRPQQGYSLAIRQKWATHPGEVDDFSQASPGWIFHTRSQ